MFFVLILPNLLWYKHAHFSALEPLLSKIKVCQKCHKEGWETWFTLLKVSKRLLNV